MKLPSNSHSLAALSAFALSFIASPAAQAGAVVRHLNHGRNLGLSASNLQVRAALAAPRRNSSGSLAAIQLLNPSVVSAGLSKTGSGSLILSGSNTFSGGFTGAVTINAGALSLSDNNVVMLGSATNLQLSQLTGTLNAGASTVVLRPGLTLTKTAAETGSNTQAVPEPSAILLSASGLVACLLRRRRA